MMRKTRSSLIDTDIILKIGEYRGEKLLRKILCSFGYNLYLHEYVVQEELIFGGLALEQLHEMIDSNEIIVMSVSDLNDDELNEYNSTLQLLANEMKVDLRRKRDRNAGEVRSMAMAFAKDFEYFISDDGGARVAAKKHLQKLDGTYLQTIRMKDVILHIRDNEEDLGINRKIAKRLYLHGTNSNLARTQDESRELKRIRAILKNEFDNNLWPKE
ncbi:MAG: hypothetical protein KAX49_18705 [Halanaerobiales bacterium]|nr:hypothetical protein [Halanaerobiales bacterium]